MDARRDHAHPRADWLVGTSTWLAERTYRNVPNAKCARRFAAAPVVTLTGIVAAITLKARLRGSVNPSISAGPADKMQVPEPAPRTIGNKLLLLRLAPSFGCAKARFGLFDATAERRDRLGPGRRWRLGEQSGALAAVEAVGVLGWPPDDIRMLSIACSSVPLDVPKGAGLGTLNKGSSRSSPAGNPRLPREP
jgi:hypothetical protein